MAKGEEDRQPGASDMRELVWDDELAAIAQRSNLSLEQTMSCKVKLNLKHKRYIVRLSIQD